MGRARGRGGVLITWRGIVLSTTTLRGHTQTHQYNRTLATADSRPFISYPVRLFLCCEYKESTVSSISVYSLLRAKYKSLSCWKAICSFARYQGSLHVCSFEGSAQFYSLEVERLQTMSSNQHKWRQQLSVLSEQRRTSERTAHVLINSHRRTTEFASSCFAVILFEPRPNLQTTPQSEHGQHDEGTNIHV